MFKKTYILLSCVVLALAGVANAAPGEVAAPAVHAEAGHAAVAGAAGHADGEGHAAEGGHGESHGLPLHAVPVPGLPKWLPLTNSMVMVLFVSAMVILVCQLATRKLTLVPSGLQNLVEAMVEGLYNFLEGILGAHLVKRTFWFFATIFIIILFTNWAGLIPGVGTVGWGVNHESWHVSSPLLRGGNADLNMTLAMAVLFAVLWGYWAISENGIGAFVGHIFGAKGVFQGFMKLFMVLVFLFVGVLETVSILFRPVSLSLRLFGNIFAGENILEAMMRVVPSWLAWLPPLPFYFLELLVGLIQALVFTLLTAVFLRLICEHDHHDDAHDSHDAHPKGAH